MNIVDNPYRIGKENFDNFIWIKTTSGAAVLIWCVKIYNILMTFPCLAPVANIKLEDREKSFNNTIKS